MSLTAEQEIQFLVQLQRLLTEGQFVATYKYALLMALADLSVEKGKDDGSTLPIHTPELADKVIRYYWRQCIPYPGSKVEVFRQNTGKEAGIIRLVRGAKSQTPTLAALTSDTKQWRKLIGAVDRIVRNMPLWKLQTIGDQRLNFLYDNLDAGNQIELKPGIAACFRKYYGLIAELVKGAWLRYVRQHNQDVLGSAKDLQEFLFGSERADLSVVAGVLNEFQQGKCFYCERGLVKDAAHVDHFIPWSRYPVDLGHNLVLAHDRCNASKSDRLAAIDHLSKWAEIVRMPELKMALDSKKVTNDLSVSIRVTQWAYQQNQMVGGLTWVKGNELMLVPDGWLKVLEA